MINLRLPLSLAKGYRSPSQIVRVVTESWFENFVECPSCAEAVTKTLNNTPGLDFVCNSCDLSFELKSKRGVLGAKIVDGAYQSMISKVLAGTQSNFFLLSYNHEYVVTDLMLIPKRFIVPELVERRKPLVSGTRRAGWVGCNLRISHVPEVGKIFYVKDNLIVSTSEILSQWENTAFLENVSLPSRSWLIAVMRCVEKMSKSDFTIQEIYEFVPYLQIMFPKNKHVQAKIRQQLQVLRDRGWLKFRGGGRYSRNTMS